MRALLVVAAVTFLSAGCGMVRANSDTPDAAQPPLADASRRDARHEAGEPDATLSRDSSPETAPTLDAPVCAPPLIACSSACIDPDTDLHHCGACATDCTALAHVEGVSCQAGACQFTCAPGYANCADAGGGCVTSLSSSVACGSCAISCSGDTPICGQVLTDGGTLLPPMDGGTACVEGCTPATEVRCGGLCVDEQTDVNNCGGCGIPCSGQCALGRCLVNLASTQSFTTGLATSLAVDSTSVYWLTSPLAVCRMPINGGAVVTNALPAVSGDIPSIALGPNGIYVSSDQGVVVAPYDGGAGAYFPADAGVYAYSPRDLAAGASMLFWTSQSSGSVFMAPFDGGPATLIATDSNDPQWIVAGSSSVYWSDLSDAGVVSAALDGGAVAVEPWSLVALGGPRLVWAAGDLYVATDTSILRVAGGLGSPTVVASGIANLTSFAADGTNVYWAEHGPDVIMSQPIQGGAVTTLATALPSEAVSLVVDATSLYWIDSLSEDLLKLTPK